MSSSNAWFWVGYFLERAVSISNGRVNIQPAAEPIVFLSDSILREKLSEKGARKARLVRCDRFLELMLRSREVSVVVSPLAAKETAWDNQVSIRKGKASVFQVLGRILKQVGLEFSVVNGAVFIHKPGETIRLKRELKPGSQKQVDGEL